MDQFRRPKQDDRPDRVRRETYFQSRPSETGNRYGRALEREVTFSGSEPTEADRVAHRALEGEEEHRRRHGDD